MELVEFLFSAGTGGILGGILSLGKLFGKYKEKKLIFQHQVNMAEQDRLNMGKEIELAQVKGEIDAKITETETDAKSLQAAINAEAQATSEWPWVQAVKALIRPSLTVILLFMAFICVLWASDNPHTPQIIFLASTAVTFWFGDRPRRQI